MRHVRLWAIACVIAEGCGDVGQDELQVQRSKWHALGVGDYAFIWRESCFCNVPDSEGIRVEIHEGLATTAVGVSVAEAEPEYAVTIDGIFDRVLEFLEHDPEVHEIRYDPTYHYPAEFNGDLDTNAEDDSYSLVVSCFARDPEQGCPVLSVTSDECAARGGVSKPLPMLGGSPVCDGYPAYGRISDADAASVCCKGPMSN